MQSNKNPLISLFCMWLLSACNGGGSSNVNLKNNNNSTVLSSKTTLGIQAKLSPFNIYVQESMRDYKFALVYSYESSNHSIINSVAVSFISDNAEKEGVKIYTKDLNSNHLDNILITNHSNGYYAGKTNYLLAKIDPSKDLPDLGAETNFYTSRVASDLSLTAFYTDLFLYDNHGDYFDKTGWVQISKNKVDEAQRICGQNITILPDQNFSCTSKNSLLASVGVKASHINPESPSLPAAAIRVSEKSSTSYRNSLQFIAIGNFGLLNLEIKNTTNTSLQNIKFDTLNGTANFSANNFYTTCKLDGLQKLAAGESCEFVIKYLPTMVESGLVTIRTTATNYSGVQDEVSTNINYSSHSRN